MAEPSSRAWRLSPRVTRADRRPPARRRDGARAWGAERFTDGALRAAARFSLSTFYVGAVVSGFEPENLVTGVAAAVDGLDRVALGTVIGSSVFLLTGALGLTLFLVPMEVRILAPHARELLEHLCRYLLRPPLALERLAESSNGQLLYELVHPRRDGSTPLLLDPLELIEKICVLVAPPRFHTLRFHGVLAAPAAWRSQIIPGPRNDVDQEAAAEVASDVPVAVAGSPPSSRSSGLSWSALLKRVFAIDVLRCAQCGGRRRIVGVYTGPTTFAAAAPEHGFPLADAGVVDRAPPPEPS